jgi:ABC-type lipoprotein release transport system permease subunit
METSHKSPLSGPEFRDIWRNENRNQFPHLLRIGVKFGVMTLQVILSSIFNFHRNLIWEIYTSLTHVYVIISAHAPRKRVMFRMW